ncbi:MAG TPA: DUF4383 domain-containing protein [Solirubrobacterales bacterium]|nr:DUF4383 domain-containing protein [Solirubrobacterales bacterium]
MEPPSPARLYAGLVGALLVVLGILGFFYDASFGQLDSYEKAFAGLQVNGWLNLFFVATGSVGVLVAGASSRGYALTVGLLYTLLTIVGWGSGWLFLVIGVLGLAAAAGTPRRGGASPSSKPRAKPARQRA